MSILFKLSRFVRDDEYKGAKIDHATLQRWVIRFIPLIEQAVRSRKKDVGSSWKMDKTCIKLNGQWVYLYRSLYILGNTVDFLLRKNRDKPATLGFFRKAFRENNCPEKVVIDKSGSNTAALNDLNTEVPEDYEIKVIQKQYLNNLVGQDHRFIEKRTKPMLGFESFHSAQMTITGIENVCMIQKRQIIGNNDTVSTFENFKMLMAA